MISLTETAADKVKFNLAQRPTGLGIRVGVKTTGCSGLAYVLEFVDAPHGPRDDDVGFVSHGAASAQIRQNQTTGGRDANHLATIGGNIHIVFFSG